MEHLSDDGAIYVSFDVKTVSAINVDKHVYNQSSDAKYMKLVRDFLRFRPSGPSGVPVTG